MNPGNPHPADICPHKKWQQSELSEAVVDWINQEINIERKKSRLDSDYIEFLEHARRKHGDLPHQTSGSHRCSLSHLSRFSPNL